MSSKLHDTRSKCIT